MPTLDEQVFRALYAGDHRGMLSTVMFVVTTLGNGWVMVICLPLLTATRVRRVVLGLGAVLAAQGALVGGIKWWVARARPWQVLGLHPVFGVPTGLSFPSGHAAGAFTVALFIATVWRPGSPPDDAPLPARTRGRRAVKAGLFVLAGLVALSRVVLGAHYPSDVAAGSLVGALAGWLGGRAYIRYTAHFVRHGSRPVRDSSPT